MNIGSRRLPIHLGEKMKQSPLILLTIELEKRIDNVHAEYIDRDLSEYQTAYGRERGFDAWANNLLSSLERIQKRLGGVRYKKLQGIMQDAIKQQRVADNADRHRDWIYDLLIDYYDPMYDYQLTKKQDRIIFQGTGQDVLHYISENTWHYSCSYPIIPT